MIYLYLQQTTILSQINRGLVLRLRVSHTIYMFLKLLLLSALCSITDYGLHSFGLLVFKYCVSVKAFSACQLGKCVTDFCLIYFIKKVAFDWFN